MRTLRVDLSPTLRYWTLVDDRYEEIQPIGAFLLHSRVGQDLAELTTKSYAESLGLFLRWKGQRDYERAAAELSWFVAELRTVPVTRPGAAFGRPRGARRINAVLAAVRSFYKFAIDHGDVPPAVLTRLFQVADVAALPAHLRSDGRGPGYQALPRHRLRIDRSAEPKGVTPEEVDRLVGAARWWRDRLIVTLLWATGLRVGQALGLRRSDVHFLEDSRSLGCTWEGGPHLHVERRVNENDVWSKRRAPLIVPAPWPVLACYEHYLSERAAILLGESSDFLLVNLFREPLGRPMRYQTVRDLIARLADGAGVERKITPHALRHGFGRAMTDSGVDLPSIQRLMGHAQIESTAIYTTPSARSMREAVERLPEVNSLRRTLT